MKTKPFDIMSAKNGAEIVFIKTYQLGGSFAYPAEIIKYSPVVALFHNGGCPAALVFDDSGFELHCSTALPYELRGQLQIVIKPKFASDLTGIKKGDKVWDFVDGWGEVITSTHQDEISVKFGKYMWDYDLTGRKIWKTDKSLDHNQSLFLSEIKFEIPKIDY